ncbi:MAG: tRNA lysidine(34) synthetase TilS [Candidatus Rhabdochlamydia sp.]
MRCILTETLKKFLNKHLNSSNPVIIGYSGGSDSKALLYLLMKCRVSFPLNLHVVHIDHGWREESHQESLALEQEIKQLGLPFYGYQIQSVTQTEEAARNARLSIFEKISHQLQAQAVILAHHQDDQAETVLKRVLEGASLEKCTGMTSVSLWNQTVIWRPLLSSKKKDLVRWLEQQGLLFLEDHTNLSPRYLRGRMRTSLLPYLEEVFGKSVRKNLCLLGKRCEVIQKDLARRCVPLFEMIEEESTVWLSSLREFDDVVLEYFFRRWVKKWGMRLSAPQLELVVQMVKKENPVALIQTGPYCITIGKGRLALKKLDRYLDGKGT